MEPIDIKKLINANIYIFLSVELWYVSNSISHMFGFVLS